MAVTGYEVSLGTAVAPVVSMSADSQYVVLQNVEPASTVPELSRAGRVYVVEQKFTLPGSGSVSLNIATPATGFQIEFYEIVTSRATVFAELIEGATVTTNGTAIPSYNLNRNFDDDAASVFEGVTSFTGGTTISAELIVGSVSGGGSSETFSKIHTLNASEDYVIRFTNETENQSICFVGIGFTEKFNGQDDIFLASDSGEGFRLRGGESVGLTMIQGQKLMASASEAAVLSVLKQD